MLGSKRLLITGASGLLAPYIIDAAEGYEVTTTSRSNSHFIVDLEEPLLVKELLNKTTPDVVIHLAALTDIEECEKNVAQAYSSNALATFNVANSLPEDCKMIYISTDQVYPGVQGTYEENRVAPVNLYGRSKLLGECAALSHQNTCVLRTNFFGPSRVKNRKSLSDYFIDGFKSGKEMILFSDLLFSPLHARTLSEIIIHTIDKKYIGVYNIGSRDGASKSDFALRIRKFLDADISNVTVQSSDKSLNRSPRPKDIRLNVDKFEKVYGHKMPTLNDEIKKLFSDDNEHEC